jgi:phosphohistidine phosphatase
MKLLVIRHAIAEDSKEAAGGDDAERALTPRGRRRMRAAARGLCRVAPAVDMLATSPLTRAVQTADIVAAAYKDLKVVKLGHLAPDTSIHALLKWLQERKHESAVALVGHEPQLGVFVSWMLTGLQDSFVRLKKGGACLVELNEQVRPGRGRLLWSLAPAQLRQLGSD